LTFHALQYKSQIQLIKMHLQHRKYEDRATGCCYTDRNTV